MDTARLFHDLLCRPAAEVPVPLLRTVADFLAAAGADPHQSITLIAGNPRTPTDLLAGYLRHPSPWVRKTALSNPATPADAAVAAIRRERHVEVLTHVAAKADRPELHRVLATRALPPKHVHTVLAGVLYADLLEDAETVALLLRAQALRGPDSEDLDDAVRSVLGTRPRVAALTLPSLTVPEFMEAAARSGGLDEAGWATLEGLLLTPLAASVDPAAAATNGQVQVLRSLMTNRAVPAPLRERILTLFLSVEGHGRWWDAAEDARALRAREVTDTDLVALARSDDPDSLKAALAHRDLTEDLALAIACSPHAQPGTVASAFVRSGAGPDTLATVVAAHDDPQVLTELARRVGPSLVATLPSAAAARLRELVWAHLCSQDRYPGARGGIDHDWKEAADALGAEDLRELPWPLACGLAVRCSGPRDVLGDTLAQALASAGAARVFAAVQEGFAGSTGELLDGLAAVDAA